MLVVETVLGPSVGKMTKPYIVTWEMIRRFRENGWTIRHVDVPHIRYEDTELEETVREWEKVCDIKDRLDKLIFQKSPPPPEEGSDNPCGEIVL